MNVAPPYKGPTVAQVTKLKILETKKKIKELEESLIVLERRYERYFDSPVMELDRLATEERLRNKNSLNLNLVNCT